MTDRLGCFWYVGKTQSGKSTKALEDLNEDVRTTGRPSLILDCMPAWNFRDEPHAASVKEALDNLYIRGTRSVYTPQSPGELDQVMSIVRQFGKVHILWDECSFYMSFRTITQETSRAVRGWAHSENTFRLVTQRPGDIHGDGYACDPEVYAFRTEKEGDLKRLKEEFQFDPERLRGLARHEFETKKRGF